MSDKELTPYLLAKKAQERGTTIAEGKACQKCKEPMAHYYYVRELKGRAVLNGCIWCLHLDGKTPPAVKADVVEVKSDGVMVYGGRKCSKCGTSERLAEKAHGAKQGACYMCSLEAASEKIGKTQINRLRQQIKAQTNQFIIQSIERSGTVEVAPANLAEYFLVRALMEDRDRLNAAIWEDDNAVWEIGHKFPASGGGTGHRGKATVENLCLIRREQNRSQKDQLPEDWSITQTVWIGDAYTSISSREAATAWRERMGWNDATSKEKNAQKAAEDAETRKHKERVRQYAVALANVEGLAISTEDELQTIYGKVSERIERLHKKMRAVIRENHKNGVRVWQSEGGLTEEALHGLNARYRIIYNTIGQFIDAVTAKEKTLNEADKCCFLSESNIVKRALVWWCQDVLKAVNRDVSGFTHPLLTSLTEPKSWGLKVGADGRQWLCGWLIKEDGEQEPQEATESRNAEWVSLSIQEFQRQQHERKEAVKQRFVELVAKGLEWCKKCQELNDKPAPEIDVSDCFTDEDKAIKIEAVKRIRAKDNYNPFTNFEEKRSRLNEWWSSTIRRRLSASDIENEATELYPMFAQYETEPRERGHYITPHEISAMVATVAKEFYGMSETPF